jgi:hypothetical protein
LLKPPSTSPIALAATVLATALLGVVHPAIATPDAGQVRAEITLFPTRVVLEGADRSADVTVNSGGSVAGAFRVGFTFVRMDPSGTVRQVTDLSDRERLAASLVRVSPRQFVVQPFGSQRIRLGLRKPADLPDGEYRVNLHIEEIPTGGTRAASAPDEAFSASVVILTAVSVPLIVRHGRLDVRVTLADLRIEHPAGKPATVSATLVRDGNRSAYGDLTATFQPKGSSAPVEVAQVKGVAVYAEVERRPIQLDVAASAPASLRGGRLTLSYRLPTEQGGALLAESTVLLP